MDQASGGRRNPPGKVVFQTWLGRLGSTWLVERGQRLRKETAQLLRKETAQLSKKAQLLRKTAMMDGYRSRKKSIRRWTIRLEIHPAVGGIGSSTTSGRAGSSGRTRTTPSLQQTRMPGLNPGLRHQTVAVLILSRVSRVHCPSHSLSRSPPRAVVCTAKSPGRRRDRNSRNGSGSQGSKSFELSSNKQLQFTLICAVLQNCSSAAQ